MLNGIQTYHMHTNMHTDIIIIIIIIITTIILFGFI